MSATAASLRRIAASPYAKRLARERGLALEAIAGSGPQGRIIAVDIVAVPHAGATAPATGSQEAALATNVSLVTLRQMLTGVTSAETSFRSRTWHSGRRAVRSTTSRRPPPCRRARSARNTVDGVRAQLVFADIRKARWGRCGGASAALEAGHDEADAAAALSLRVLEAADIRPVTMPLLPGRAMRLVLIAGGTEAECLLTFDAATIDEDVATEVLARFKSYLDTPIRLLA